MTPPVAVVLSIEERIEVRPRVEVVAFAKRAVVPVKLVAVIVAALMLVVVALVPVASAKSKLAKCEVLEAYIPCCAQIGVLVALVVTA